MFDKFQFKFAENISFNKDLTKEDIEKGEITKTFTIKDLYLKDQNGILWIKTESGYKPQPLDLEVIVELDEYYPAEDPLKEEGMYQFLCLHKNYYTTKEYRKVDGYDISDIHYDYPSFANFFETKNYIYQPVYMYSHSENTISSGPFSDSWDSGLFGYLYTDIEDAKKNFLNDEITKEKILEDMKRFINGSWKQYFEGDYYYFNIKDKNGSEFANDITETVFTDSCCKEEAEKAKQRILEKYNEIYKEYV